MKTHSKKAATLRLPRLGAPLAITLLVALMLYIGSLPCFGVDILNYNAADDTTTITIEDVLGDPGKNQLIDDAVPAPTIMVGIDFLSVNSGNGSETIILNAIDLTSGLGSISLSGDNDAGTDNSDDVFLITPSTLAEVSLEGGAGQDRLEIEADGNAVTGTATSITLAGHQPVNFAAGDIERIDLLGADADDDAFELSPSTAAEIHVEGGNGFDTLTVIAPLPLITDTGTYIEVCNHERIHYTGIEQVTTQAPAVTDTLNFSAAATDPITISDVAAMPLTEQIKQGALPSVQFTNIDHLTVTHHASGNTVELQALDPCSWLLEIDLVGQGGDDTFEVTAQVIAQVDVQGGAGLDTLTVDALGNVAVDWGTHISVAGYQDVTYSGIETVTLINVAPSASMEVQGDGHVIANGDVTPSAHDFTDFGDVPVDKGVSQSFIVHSLNAVDLQLADSPPVVLTGSADFSVSLQPSELPIAQGETSKLTIRCTPSEVGTHRATVSIANNDPTKDPYQFDIKCTGTQAPEISVRGNNQEIVNGDDTPSASDHTEFGYLGQTNITRTFRIRNTGTEELHLYNAPNYVTVSQGQFEVTHQPEQEIAVDGATTFAITVTPGAEDSPTAVVSIWNTDANEDPFTFTVHAGGSEEETGPWPDAGPDQTVTVGEVVVLDGSGSRDTQVASLAQPTNPTIGPRAIEDYRWEFAVQSGASGQSGFMIPEGSMCMTSALGFNTPIASFVPDVEGSYVLELHVTNDLGVTMMDTVVITALAALEPIGDFRLDRFSVAPNPFSSWITFGFEGEGIADHIEASVYDLTGRRLWLARSQDVRQITWNGRMSDGVMLQNGPYICTLTIIANGQRYYHRGVIFINR